MTCSDVANHRMEGLESLREGYSVFLDLTFSRLQRSLLQRYLQEARRLLYVFRKSFTISALGIGLDPCLGIKTG